MWFCTKRTNQIKELDVLDHEVEAAVKKNNKLQDKITEEAKEVGKELGHITAENGFHLVLYRAVNGHKGVH